MADPVPRYEYRAFSQGFGPVEDRIRQGRICEDVAESREVYLLQADILERNVKLRGGRLELKTLVEAREGLQRWAPSGQWEFPIPARDLAERVFPELDSRLWEAVSEGVDEAALLERIASTGRELLRADLFKRRFRFDVDGCPGEIDDILVNGAAIRSAAVESADPDHLQRVIRDIGLDVYPNTAYPAMLARIMGLEPANAETDDG